MSQAPKKLVGPVGPHLLRYSFEALQDSLEEYEEAPRWSPIASPRRAGPTVRVNPKAQSADEQIPPSSVPLELWEPHQVAGWMRVRGYEESLIESFRMNDISGGILKDLKYGDLQELGIRSFGLRQNLWNDVRNLRGGSGSPSTPAEECSSPMPSYPAAQFPQAHQPTQQQRRPSPCSNPQSPEDEGGKSPAVSRRRARRALRPDDVISPAESASIVAIEQLLPKPHHCSKGENCSKWRKQQRQLARIAREFPLELEQIDEAKASSEVNFRPTSEAASSVLPSVVASSDLLGPGVPSLRLDEDVLRIVPPRDPQDNVRQFINFQHLDSPQIDSSPINYEVSSPPLSPRGTTQAPHTKLASLPFKLTIPTEPSAAHGPLLADGDRTVVRQTRTPVTAMQGWEGQSQNFSSYEDPTAYSHGRDIYRLGSPASAMDVPLTAIPSGPIARDASQSVPPDMRYRDLEAISRSTSRAEHRQYFNPYDQQYSQQLFSPITTPIQRPSTTTPSTGVSRSNSTATRSQKSSRRPSFAMSPVQEYSGQQSLPSKAEVNRDSTASSSKQAPGPNDSNYEGWMKKRKTKMLRHEWHENHFRLKGTTLAMHRDSKALDALEYIDVDEYAVACSSVASNKKLNAAFKSLKLKADKKDDVSAFSFQLVPSAEKDKAAFFEKGAKTHHFAVKNREERIDWMRELMLAKALKQKGEGCEVNLNGQNFI